MVIDGKNSGLEFIKIFLLNVKMEKDEEVLS